MPVLKFSAAATTIYTTPCKWVRTAAATKPTTTVPLSPETRRNPSSPVLSLLLATTTTLDNASWRTLRPCAHLSPAAHVSPHLYPFVIINDSHNRNNNPQTGNQRLGLGFGASHRHRFSSSSPADNTTSSSSRDSGSGIAAEDMGQGNGFAADQSPPTQQHRHPSSSSSSSSSKLLTLPTILTLGRVAAVPLLIATFYVDGWWGRTATTSIFIAAAITDWLDGYIARKMRLGSVFGAFLDPVADKLMVAATLILLCTRPMEVSMFGQVPWLLTVPSVAIIGREITMSAVREWAASQNSKLLEAVAVNNLGKWKTATQMTALTILLATRDSNVGALVASGVVLLYISAGLSIWSLAVYMGKIWKVLLK